MKAKQAPKKPARTQKRPITKHKKPVKKPVVAARQSEVYATPRIDGPGYQKFVAFCGAVVGISIILFLVTIFNGTPKGLWYNIKPLPNFESGKIYDARDGYRASMAALNGKLEGMTQKQYSFPYIDICERSLNNLFTTSFYQASCTRTTSRLYFTDKPVCDIYNDIISSGLASYPNLQSCDVTVAANGMVAIAIGKPEDGSVVDISTTPVQAESLGRLAYATRFSGSNCTRKAFCQYFEGDYREWPTKLNSETYPTVLLLHASKTYYKK